MGYLYGENKLIKLFFIFVFSNIILFLKTIENCHRKQFFFKNFFLKHCQIGICNIWFQQFLKCSYGFCFNRWTINTKYYTADVSVWMAHLHEGFSIGNLPMLDQLAAVVMVFDMNDVSPILLLSEFFVKASISFVGTASL